MQQYLEESEFINWTSPDVQALAISLKGELLTDVAIATKCFEYVRDFIKHTGDYQIDQITCKASDVLKYKTGYCYSKSHLLAALLRANGIPAGLCYQRLSLMGDGAPYSLHGFNAVFLKDFAWYRVDPRGNKEGVDAQFIPPKERLAFKINDSQEADIQGVWSKPLSIVSDVLCQYKTCADVFNNLPDIAVYGSGLSDQ